MYWPVDRSRLIVPVVPPSDRCHVGSYNEAPPAVSEDYYCWPPFAQSFPDDPGGIRNRPAVQIYEYSRGPTGERPAVCSLAAEVCWLGGGRGPARDVPPHLAKVITMRRYMALRLSGPGVSSPYRSLVLRQLSSATALESPDVVRRYFGRLLLPGGYDVVVQRCRGGITQEPAPGTPTEIPATASLGPQFPSDQHNCCGMSPVMSRTVFLSRKASCLSGTGKPAKNCPSRDEPSQSLKKQRPST